MKSHTLRTASLVAGFVVLIVFVWMVYSAATSVFAATAIFSDTFGVVNNSDVPDWADVNPADAVIGAGEDAPLDGAFAKIGKNGSIRRDVDADDYEGLTLYYYYNGDADAEGDDFGTLEYCAGATCNSGFVQLASHPLNTTGWSVEQSVALPASLDHTQFRLRFRASVSATDEFFRVDSVRLEGTYARPDLVVVKTNNTNGTTTVGGAFNWTIRVRNNGTANAVFDKGEDLLRDNMPAGAGMDNYGTPMVVPSGLSGNGSVVCSQNGSDKENLTCEVGNGSGTRKVIMPPDSFFDVTVEVHPTNPATLTNPRPGQNNVCRADPSGKVAELNDEDSGQNNNNCSDSVTVTNPNSIAGTKYNDLNGNGTRDDGEPVLAGWHILLSGSASDEEITDQDGNYLFTGLGNGEYAVCEVSQDGWTQTAPDNEVCDGRGGYELELSGGTAVTGKDFGNVRKAHIVVRKTTNPQDFDGSFVFSIGDEQFNLSGGGEYTTSVVAGTYSVIENVPDGWTLSDSTCDPTGVEVTSGEQVTVEAGDTVTCTFTNAQLGRIIIKKVTEPEQGENGEAFSFDVSYEDEPIVLSNDNDYETESGWLQPGSGYSVVETVPDGWDLTSVNCSDDSDPDDIDLSPGEVVTCTFTNTQRGSVGLEKIAIPNEGLFTFNLSGSSNPDPLSWTGSGVGSWPDLIPGLYTLTESLPEGWTGLQSATCDETTSDSGSVQFTLEPGATVNCVFNNTQYGVITGKKFNDKDNDGVVNERGEKSGIKNWPIELWHQNPQRVEGDPDFDLLRISDTGNGGNYSFTGLEPGLYRVCEGVKDGWSQTYPVGGSVCGNGTTGYQLDVRAGETKTGINFGNFARGSISGRKFEDTDGNGKRNNTRANPEPWLSGWVIYLDLNDNQARDEGELFVETDSDGKYTFADLDPGTYVVREEIPAGWTQTKPGGTTQAYTVTIVSGKNVKNKNFGNRHITTITGYKWEDNDGDGAGIWDKEELGLRNWTIALGKVLPDPNPEDQTVPIEIIALSLTGSNGAYSFTVTEPGTYKVFEEQRDGWTPTSPNPQVDSFFDITYRIDAQPPLVLDSFFDVFVELIDGSNITVDTHEHPLNFGNKSTPTPSETPVSEPLAVNDESFFDVTDTSTEISWTTNHPATSRVIYDTVSHPELGETSCPNPNGSLQCYGYANTTNETDTDPMVTEHTATITGLTPGTTYYYRSVSHGSPETTGTEGTFTTETGATPSPTLTPTPTPEQTSGGGGGSGGAAILWPTPTSTPTPTPTPTSVPTLTPTPTVTIAGSDTDNSESELSGTGEPIPSTTVLAVASTTPSPEAVLGASETPMPTASNSLLANIGGVFSFGTGSNWFWLLWLAVLGALVVWFNSYRANAGK